MADVLWEDLQHYSWDPLEGVDTVEKPLRDVEGSLV
jgi:hypothetical protein